MSTDAELRALVVEAMFKSLDEKKREALIKGALENLIAPTQGSGYNYDRRSALEVAYDSAVQGVAREEVEKHFRENGKIREMIQGLVIKGFEKIVGNETAYSELVDSIARSIGHAFRYKE